MQQPYTPNRPIYPATSYRDKVTRCSAIATVGDRNIATPGQI